MFKSFLQQLYLNCTVSVIFLCLTYQTVFSQTGQLTVTSQPIGAQVWLDDREFGTTPFYNRDLKTGFHTIRLVDPESGATTLQSVHIIPDSLVALQINLTGSTGYLNVDSKPAGAEVALVTILGTTPLRNTPVNPGAYSIRIEHPKKLYNRVVEDAIVPQNGTLPISTQLPKNKQYIGKTTARILFGISSIGFYTWGFTAQTKHNTVGGSVGFALGTVCLIGVEIFSF